jgi:hypothetical protein
MSILDEKAIMAAAFRRSGSSGRYVRLFDDLDEQQRDQLLRSARSQEDEAPVIGSIEAPDRWLLLTTRRLVWRNEADAIALSLDDLVAAQADLRTLREGGRTKRDLRELGITTTTRQHVLEIEPGPPFSGLWNLLQSIAQSNQRRRAAHSS